MKISRMQEEIKKEINRIKSEVAFILKLTVLFM